MSVNLIVDLVPYLNWSNLGVTQVLNGTSWWLFMRYSWAAGTLVPKNHNFLVYVSVCLLAYFLIKIRQIYGHCQFVAGKYVSYLSLLQDIFLFPVRGCCAVTVYLLEACWEQINFTAQQPRTGNRKICPEVIKDKIYCQVQNTFLSELPVKNDRKRYALDIFSIRHP